MVSDLERQRAGGGGGGGRTNESTRLPAPTLGWNTRDSVETMKASYAITLENWIPGFGGVRLREGVQVVSTGIPAAVETLMEYAPPNASGRKFFAAAGNEIYDVSAAGPVGAAVQSDLGSALFQSTMFTTSAGAYLYMVNGVDAPRYFDGSSWTEPELTGLTDEDFIQVAAHQSRLWFVEKRSLHGWYLATSSIAGTATKFDFGPLCKLGGELMAFGTWTRDGGNGPDDLFVAITSEGETLIYSGTNPAAQATWALGGVFRLPRPIGHRCFIRAGADLGVLTVEGPVSLEAVLPAAGSAQRIGTLTSSIAPTFRNALAAAPQDSRWSILEYPSAGLVLINVPGVNAATSAQFVVSADTGGWSRFVNINAVCMGLFNERLHFGTAGGEVLRYGGLYTDRDVPIVARMQTAFVALGGNENKRATMARPVMQAAPGFAPNFVIKTNYDTSLPALDINSVPSTLPALWDVALWDQSSWQVSAVPVLKWRSVVGMGSVISVAFAMSSDIGVSMQAIDLLFDQGGAL